MAQAHWRACVNTFPGPILSKVFHHVGVITSRSKRIARVPVSGWEDGLEWAGWWVHTCVMSKQGCSKCRAHQGVKREKGGSGPGGRGAPSKSVALCVLCFLAQNAEKSSTADCFQGILVQAGRQNVTFNCVLALYVTFEYVVIWNVDLYLSFCSKPQMSKSGCPIAFLTSASWDTSVCPSPALLPSEGWLVSASFHYRILVLSLKKTGCFPVCGHYKLHWNKSKYAPFCAYSQLFQKDKVLEWEWQSRGVDQLRFECTKFSPTGNAEENTSSLHPRQQFKNIFQGLFLSTSNALNS